MDSQDVYMLLSPSLYTQCVVGLSYNGIAKVLGLPEYVATTSKVSTTQQAYNHTILNRHMGAMHNRLSPLAYALETYLMLCTKTLPLSHTET